METIVTCVTVLLSVAMACHTVVTVARMRLMRHTVDSATVKQGLRDMVEAFRKEADA